MKFTEASAVVTGGGSGLGAAAAAALIAAGAHCTIFDTDAASGSAHAEALGPRASFANVDVTDAAQVEQALDALSGPPLRILVNCAFVGTLAPVVNADGVPHDQGLFNRVINVTLNGTFNTLRLATLRLIRNTPDEGGERGVIINTASLASAEGQPGMAAYAAAKAGVIGLMLPAARDLAPFGVRVMTISPGTFGTPAVLRLPKAIQDDLAATALFPPRLGVPEEFGRLVLHICENPFLNAETIKLHAGAVLPAR